MSEYDEEVDVAREVLKDPVAFVTIEDETSHTVACDETGRIVGIFQPMRGWANYAGDRFAA